MGAHKGRKWKDKPSKVHYHTTGQRLKNKLARIRRNNGPKAAAAYEAGYNRNPPMKARA